MPGNKPNTFVAVVLALLLPGAGHFYLRKRWNAAAFFVSVISLSVVGWLINGEMHSLLRANSGEGFLQLMASVGNLFLGLLHMVFYFLGLALGDVSARSYEYGTTFIVTAALINLLVVLDAFDRARGDKK